MTPYRLDHIALLVRDLVPLLDRYSAACERQDGNARLALADAIFQGLSADPELLLTRLDLLGPSTMIEDLFVDYGGTNFPRESPGSPGLLERSSIVRSVPLQGDRVKVRLKPDTTYYTGHPSFDAEPQRTGRRFECIVPDVNSVPPCPRVEMALRALAHRISKAAISRMLRTSSVPSVTLSAEIIAGQFRQR